MIKRPKVTTLTKAKHIYKLHCGECNWEQVVASGTDEDLKCCPWCGWGDLEISKVKKSGGFQIINCEKHGNITVAITSDEVVPDDFMDNFFCPFCE